jgi:hypothetical protein
MLTLIAAPDRRQESVRDLLRARGDVRKNVLSARHRLSKFLLRRGRRYREGSTWKTGHWNWIRSPRRFALAIHALRQRQLPTHHRHAVPNPRISE